MRKELHAALRVGVSEVGNRVYPLILPQDTQHNSLTYTIVSELETNVGYCGIAPTKSFNVQVDVFAHTYAQSIELKDKVIKALRKEFKISGVRSFEFYEHFVLKYRQVVDLTVAMVPTHAIIHVPDPAICNLSIGGASGTEFSMVGIWRPDCTMFKN